MWRERFEKMIGELQAHPDVDVWMSDLGDPDTNVFDQVEEELGAPLPDDVRGFYSEIGRVNVSWVHNDASLNAGGSFNIGPVLDSYGAPWTRDDAYPRYVIRPFDFTIDQAPAFLSKYYAGVDPAEPGVFRWVHYAENEKVPEVGYIDNRSLGFGLSEYLDAALQARGFAFWQEAFATPKVDTAASRHVEVMKQVLPTLFDDFVPVHFLASDDID